MSNYFEYNDYPFRELADSLEHDIAKALQPKPDKTKHDYWVIYTKETPYSFRSYSYQNEYANAETAIAALLKQVEAEPAPQELRQTYFPDETIVYAWNTPRTESRSLCSMPSTTAATRPTTQDRMCWICRTMP